MNFTPLTLCANTLDSLEDQDRLGFLGRKDLPRHPFNLPFKWDQNPFKDNNWMFLISSWRVMDPAINRYFETHNPRMLERMQAIAVDWSRFHSENPHSKWTWYDMAVGIRALRIAFLLHESARGCFRVDPHLSEMAQHHGERLMDERVVAKNNHGIFQMVGLLAIAPWVTSSQAAKDFASRKLAELADIAFTKDGIHKEHSPAYHRFVQQTFSKFRSFYDEMPDLEHTLRLAANNESWFTMPDGYLAAVGDTDHGSTGRLFQSVSPKDVVALDGQVVAFKHFAEGGYVVCRSLPSEPNPFALLVTGAKFSRSHKHADDLSFMFYWRGDPVFIDPGKYGYEYSDTRDYFTGAGAHNTVSIQGETFPTDHLLSDGSSINRVRVDSAALLIEGKITRPSLFTLRRSISFKPSTGMNISDDIRGPGKKSYQSRLHLHPSMSVRQRGGGVVVTTPKGASLTVTANQAVEIEEGLFSPSYKKTMPCKVLSISDTAAVTQLKWVLHWT